VFCQLAAKATNKIEISRYLSASIAFIPMREADGFKDRKWKGQLWSEAQFIAG